MVLKIFTDGASRGNPGQAGAGAVIYDKGVVLEQISAYLGERTNNEAEYLALIRALEWMKEKGYKNADFYCDSQLLVRQLNGEYKVKAPKVKPLFGKVKLLIGEMNVSFTWIRREENTVADSLANRAIDES